MQELTSYFEPLADTSLAIDGGIVLASFLAPSVYGPAVESFSGMDIPNEAYGVGHIVGGEVVGGSKKRLIQIGGVVYTFDQLARRYGVRDTVMSAGSN